MAGRIRTALFATLVLAPCACLGQSDVAPPLVPPHDWWFDHPEILCRALERQGFPAGAWRQLAAGSPVYQCEYPLLPSQDPPRRPIAADGPSDPPTSVFFQVSGGYPNQADRIAICITIGAPDAMPKAKRQILVYIRALYDVIGQPVPTALVAYVGQEKHYLSHQPYGVVSFFSEHRRDRRPEQLLWFRLGKNPQ